MRDYPKVSLSLEREKKKKKKRRRVAFPISSLDHPPPPLKLSKLLGVSYYKSVEEKESVKAFVMTSQTTTA